MNLICSNIVCDNVVATASRDLFDHGMICAECTDRWHQARAEALAAGGAPESIDIKAV